MFQMPYISWMQVSDLGIKALGSDMETEGRRRVMAWELEVLGLSPTFAS